MSNTLLLGVIGFGVFATVLVLATVWAMREIADHLLGTDDLIEDEEDQ